MLCGRSSWNPHLWALLIDLIIQWAHSTQDDSEIFAIDEEKSSDANYKSDRGKQKIAVVRAAGIRRPRSRLQHRVTIPMSVLVQWHIHRPAEHAALCASRTATI
ncbi:hypothetical protein B0H13DRAFT_2021052 [Mycena leptocephala]|nr:hypothetical protein B0H13DRAFT_2021052 [Mycena leptocephala]